VPSRARPAQEIAQPLEGDALGQPYPVDWRSGVTGTSNRFPGPNADAIGHSGAGGSCGFGDAKTGVAVGYVMRKHSHYVAGDPRALRLIEALYDCL
jgi:hypothetical protein